MSLGDMLHSLQSSFSPKKSSRRMNPNTMNNNHIPSKQDPVGIHSDTTQTLYNLCSHLLGPDASERAIKSNFRTALSLCASTQGTPRPMTEEKVINETKLLLIRQGLNEEAASYSRMCSDLSKMSVLSDRTAILTFLLRMAGFENNAQPHRQFPKDTNRSFLLHSIIKNNERPDLVITPTENEVIPLPRTSSNLTAQSLRSKEKESVVSSFAVNDAEKETSLMRDIIFAFQAIEGSILKYHTDRDSAMFVSGEHVDLFPSPLCKASIRLTELGWLYKQIQDFCALWSSDRQDIGLVNQAFILALKNEMSDFYRLLSILQDQLRSNKLSLIRLTVWFLEPLSRFKLLTSMIRSCDGRRGGSLISNIYTYLHHGNQSHSDCTKVVLSTVCKPMYCMLLQWIMEGALDDPFNEFFVASNSQIGGDLLWYDKYSIRESMIPSFITLTQANKILSAGKNINFLNRVCHDNRSVSARREKFKKSMESVFVEDFFLNSQNSGSLFDKTLQDAFTDTSTHVLEVLFGRYKLFEHLSAIRRYLLLGQGDVIHFLIELLETELCQPANAIYPPNLACILETAIRSTNAQYEEKYILDRLDVRLIDTQPGDTGWDVFSLNYKVDGPIGTIFGRSMNKYLMLFNALWRAKRLEYMLSAIWKKQAYLHKLSKSLPEISTLLHMVNLQTAEMIHFIHQMSYYIMFEVMECSWDMLNRQLRQADSLDRVITAHDNFVETLIKRMLLDVESQSLLIHLRSIHDRILEFETIQNDLTLFAEAEFESRNNKSGGGGVVGQKVPSRSYIYVTSSTDMQDVTSDNKFTSHTVPSLRARLKIVSQSYQEMVRTFLLELNSSQDPSLQALSFRIDFNLHYKKTDARLGAPLTFQHRRDSLMLNSNHKSKSAQKNVGSGSRESRLI